jgi:hypothetical protein
LLLLKLVVNWGYYRFTHIIISFPGVPILQAIGGGRRGNTDGFNPLISFVHSLAMVSILVWLCIAVVGKEKIYSGPRTNFSVKFRNNY